MGDSKGKPHKQAGTPGAGRFDREADDCMDSMPRLPAAPDPLPREWRPGRMNGPNGKEFVMHFLGTVIGPESESEVDRELERWSEDADVEPYIVEYREDFLERAREWASHHPNVDGGDEEALLARFAEYTGATLDGDGNAVSTVPEDAFYDWYELGGRWRGETAGLQGLTVDVLRARAETDPAVALLLDGMVVSVHGGGYEEEPADPFAGCTGTERVWFVDFHD